MTCPACTTVNGDRSVICTKCGVILRSDKFKRKAPKASLKRGAIARIAGSIAALGAGAYVAYYLVSKSPRFEGDARYAGLIGGLIGAALVYIVSGARIMIYSRRYKKQLRDLTHDIHEILTKAENEANDLLRKDPNSVQSRIQLATVHFLKNEFERSLSEFREAAVQGAEGVGYFNNFAVALAKCGALGQASETLEKALAADGHLPQPKLNFAHILTRSMRGADDGSAGRVIKALEAMAEDDSTKFVSLDKMGLALLNSSQYDQAVERFSEALQTKVDESSQLANIHYNIGLAKFRANDLKRAQEEFQLAIQRDPGHALAQCGQGLILILQGKARQGYDAILAAKQIDPKNPAICANLGFALSILGVDNDAIAEWKEAIRLDGQTWEAHYNIGKLYADEQISEPADKFLTRANEIHPECWEVQLALGVAKLQRRLHRDATTYLKAAERHQPNNPRVLANLATSLALGMEFEEAEDKMKLAANLDPENAQVHGQMAWLYMQQAKFHDAVNSLATALELDKKSAMFNNFYGLCQLGLGANDMAYLHFKRALAFQPDYHQVHYHLGFVHVLSKATGEAIKEWELTAKFETEYADGLSNLGVAYYHSGKLEEAVSMFRRVIRLRENRMEDFSNLALSYSKLGVADRTQSKAFQDRFHKKAVEKFRMAIELFDKAIDLEPNNAAMHSNRGLACWYADEIEKACQEWTLVSHIDPEYAKRRGELIKTVFDDSSVDYMALKVIDRVVGFPPNTPEYIYRVPLGYESEDWDLILDDQKLVELPKLSSDAAVVERRLRALQV